MSLVSAPVVATRAAAMAIAAVSWTSAGSAAAEPASETASVALTWSAPPGCPQREEFLTWLSGHLGTSADPAGYPGLTSRGVLERERSGWRLRLTIARDGASGEKTLRGRDCEELARSGALALAIAIEPALAGAGVTVPEPPGETEAEPSGEAVVPEAPVDGEGAPVVAGVVAESGPRAEGAVVAEPRAEAEARERAPVTVDAANSMGPTPPRRRLPIAHALRIAAGLELGALPGVGPGLLLGYALRLPWVRLELTGSWWPARRREYAERPGVGGQAQIGAAALRVCPTLRLRRAPARAGVGAAGLVELPLCVGVELGALVVSGFGFGGARAVRTLWAAAELQPGVVWRFARRVALWGAPALVVPITRDSFAVDPLPPLFRVGPAGLRVAVGLEVHLGREKN
ncbi:hypothetical protein [Nannocystis radixulma]|uniref:Uncharacterized protein n=1 Tax=Nannocystis radixulma TaxID=2995305 RepID=A0ABT5B6S1_9BACT|nr:hypothetical protein [Nannocystis radixulma]MDC0669810.1 hypothetical protein [Nannocystis radixulma]